MCSVYEVLATDAILCFPLSSDLSDSRCLDQSATVVSMMSGHTSKSKGQGLVLNIDQGVLKEHQMFQQEFYGRLRGGMQHFIESEMLIDGQFSRRRPSSSDIRDHSRMDRIHKLGASHFDKVILTSSIWRKYG